MFDLAIYVMYERAIVLSESLQLINKFVVIQELFLLLLWSIKAYTVHALSHLTWELSWHTGVLCLTVCSECGLEVQPIESHFSRYDFV